MSRQLTWPQFINRQELDHVVRCFFTNLKLEHPCSLAVHVLCPLVEFEDEHVLSVRAQNLGSKLLQANSQIPVDLFRAIGFKVKNIFCDPQHFFQTHP